MRIYALAGISLGLIIAAAVSLVSDDATSRSITLASTTSVDNSGFYSYVLPKFSEETGIGVRVIAVGTGRALNIAGKGDADLVLVHDEQSEHEFVARGDGIERRTFMYNYYILVGDKNDPAEIAATKDISSALRKIAQGRIPFISRGDNSGTHKKELSLWRFADIQVNSKYHHWYIEIGNSMGAALNMANELRAYTLSDSATWFSFKNRANLKVLVENIPPLINPYSVVLVNPKKHPHVHYRDAKIFADWLVDGNGAQWIEAFRFEGIKLFQRWRASG